MDFKKMFAVVFLFLMVFSYVETQEIADLTTRNNAKKCRVLSLEGGGDHGAYQAGALKGLIDGLPDEERNWDFVIGISAGTLNGAAFSLFDKSEEKEAADYLFKTWREIKGSQDAYVSWKNMKYLGVLYGLIYEKGLMDSSPERELLTKIVGDKKFKRDFFLGVNNIRTGKYEFYKVNDLSKEESLNAMMSSSAVPIIFPAVEFLNGDLYQDGGVSHDTDILSGIDLCKEKGFTEENIVVDILKCHGTGNITRDVTEMTSLQVLLRELNMYRNERLIREIDDVIQAFPNISFRYVIEPTVKLPNDKYPYIFDPEATEIMLKQGLEDAKNKIKEQKEKNSLNKQDIFSLLKQQKSLSDNLGFLQPKRAEPALE